MSDQTTTIPVVNQSTSTKKYIYVVEPYEDSNYGGIFLFIFFIILLVFLCSSPPYQPTKYRRYEVGKGAYLTPNRQIVQG